MGITLLAFFMPYLKLAYGLLLLLAFGYDNFNRFFWVYILSMDLYD